MKKQKFFFFTRRKGLRERVAHAMPRYSSGVPFQPSAPWWRIGGVDYDLTPFLPLHPGGRHVLLLARDRFGDATLAFEAHHLNWRGARRVLEQYRVRAAQHGEGLRLSAEGGLFCELRDRLRAALRAAGAPARGGRRARASASSGPRWPRGRASRSRRWPRAAPPSRRRWARWPPSSALGHNFVHQPAYHAHAHALDLVGLSADVWRREHVLQHHIFTNTPEDNHFKGTEPFLVVDPRARRGPLQRSVFPALAPVLLSFGIPVNHAVRLVDVARGREPLTIGDWLPFLEVALFVGCRGGAAGLALWALARGVTGALYFTIALANHNGSASAAAMARGGAVAGADEWAMHQIRACGDWDVRVQFPRNLVYLTLNLHTVHHLFPSLDISHHHIGQAVLEQTCAERGVPYRPFRSFSQLYGESLATFRGEPRS